MLFDYDPAKVESIVSYSTGLMGKTLRQATNVTDADINNGKGDLGVLVEKHYFNWTPPNNHDPDFPNAGLELKTTPVKLSKKGVITPKERLVLGMINYNTVVTEEFITSTLYNKIKLMLILFYLHEKLPVIDRRFLAQILWELPQSDLRLIVNDWDIILNKIKQGKAHELSEGDTFYLGACTKASNALQITSQPYSKIKAKPRAFSFKPSYIRVILDQKKLNSNLYANIIGDHETTSLEVKVTNMLNQYSGNSVDKLFNEFGGDISLKSKDRYSRLTYRLLGSRDKKIIEFEKAGIIIKTIRLNASGKPKEDLSFPIFRYMDIVNQEWDESDFKDVIESKFLFVVMQENVNGLIFRNAQFWNMPFSDRIECQRVWDETVRRIKNGNADNLPSKKYSAIAHVRPHGRNGKDTIDAPGGKKVVKKCFWLNAGYIKTQIDSK